MWGWVVAVWGWGIVGRTLWGWWVLSGGGRCVRVGGMWGSVVAVCEAGVMGGSNEV